MMFDRTVQDPVADGGGGSTMFYYKLHTTIGKFSLLYALEGSGGMFSWKIVKSKLLNCTF